MDYEPVIGLEVHLQLSTTTKLFCGCPTTFGAPPNSQTCPVCLGLPGVLPVLNERAFAWGIRAALAFHCEIGQTVKFDRKQYFYPDLPKNYQISQYDKPLAARGYVDLLVDGRPKRIGLTRIHLEEDAGKLLHEGSQTESLVDFNRTGVPLLEIVSEPDLRSPEEAYQYLVELKAIVQYLDVSTCNMEEGSLRCDTNVSLRPRGTQPFGSKVEVKNLNSFRAVKQALEFEIKRQATLLEAGQLIPQETRLWDAEAQQTESMRSKEMAADYRYFPEPDLVPFMIDRTLVERLRQELPELPAQRRQRFVQAYQLSPYDAQVLTQDRQLAELFEAAAKLSGKPKPVANWLMGDLMAYLNAKRLQLLAVELQPAWLVHLLELMDNGTLSGKMAKEVFLQMLERREDPAALVEQGGLRQISDVGALEQIAGEVIAEYPKSVEDYLSGKHNALMHLVGQGMKRSQGRANPQQMTDILKRKLKERVT
jgi:aspartyl-tRNA(Asn)/glutamyl-tRNA(Gln) amidotransferase subunit B